MFSIQKIDIKSFVKYIPSNKPEIKAVAMVSESFYFHKTTRNFAVKLSEYAHKLKG